MESAPAPLIGSGLLVLLGVSLARAAPLAYLGALGAVLLAIGDDSIACAAMRRGRPWRWTGSRRLASIDSQSAFEVV